MMKRDVTDLNVLYDAFRASLHGSAWKEGPQKFEIDWLSGIVKIKHQIEDRTYETQKGSEFELNERGKKRYIHGGTMPDRIVRHALCDGELQEKLTPYLIPNNSASQTGKGLSYARERFERDLHNYWLEHRTNEGYIAFVDFSKFYDNIRHDKIRELMYPIIDPDTHWVMDKILEHFRVDVSYMTDEEYQSCMERKHNSVEYYATIPPEDRQRGEKYMEKSVDIGDQVSQSIGIFFPTRIDNYVKIVRGVKRYGRYMDDMYIIHHDREELKDIVKGVTDCAKELGLYINERKTRIARLKDTYKFLQVKYTLTDTGKAIRRINPKGVTRERRKMKAYKRKEIKGDIPMEDIEQAVKSWTGSFARIMSKQQIRHMKELYKELFGKEITWKRKSHSATENPSRQKRTGTALSQSRSRVSRMNWGP